MESLTITKMTKVDSPANNDGILAFQMVRFCINFFGNEIVSVLDTKIMDDGRQLVINGDGFIKTGYEVA